VIGGGWAGCAAALTLAEAGVPVTLYESARTLGGRARGVELEGQALDNGQHILLGAYTQTLDLIAHLARPDDGLWRMPLTIDQPPDFRLVCPRLPAPLHLGAGLLAAQGLLWREKLAAARWAYRVMHGALADGTVAELTRAQPQTLRDRLWHPLCLSALNTAPEAASARVFQAVLRGAFGGRRHHSDLLLPRRDLTTLFPVPAAARICALGGRVHTGRRVLRVDANSQGVSVATAEEVIDYHRAIIAVAPQHLASLVADVPELAPAVRAVQTYAYRRIATGYVQYDPALRLASPMLALAGGPAQFVFDRGQSHGQSGLLAYVASAADDVGSDWLADAEAQLRQVMPLPTARWRRSIIEKQATYACVAEMERPPVRSNHPCLFLAGDYTAGPYPATLESATASGVQSAVSLLETL
jgi:squalene-associated FAD-dependent desaturase